LAPPLFDNSLTTHFLQGATAVHAPLRLTPLAASIFLAVAAHAQTADASAGGYPGSRYLALGAPRSFTLSATVDF
jgi:hypothetical protein